MPFGPELLMMLILLVGQTGGDVLDLISTDAYWRNQKVTVSPDQLRRDAGPDAPIASADQLIKDLSAEQFPVRSQARQKLLDQGPAIIDQLKPLTNSPDSEVAAAAQQIIQQLATHAQARSIRRLMAIRTLGERKDKDALDLLKPLLDSKDPFVADYARRALAQIAGQPYAPAFDEKAYAADLQALPKEAKIAAQIRTGALGQRLTIDTLVDQMLKAAKEQAQAEAAQAPGAAGGGGAGGAGGGEAAQPPKLPDRQKTIDRLTAQLLTALEAVGNFRLDSVTAGADFDDLLQNDKTFALLILRGQYNPQALLEFAQSNLASTPDAGLKIHKVDHIDFIDLDPATSLALLSPQRLVLIEGPLNHPAAFSALLQRLTPAATPKGGGGGAGGIAENDQLAPLLKTLDPRALAWAGGRVPKFVRNEKSFTAFDTFLAQALRDKDSLRFTVTGTGDDPEKVKASADAITDGLQQALAEGKQQAANRQALAPILTALESMKCIAAGKTATLTGTYPADILMAFLQESDWLPALGGLDEQDAPDPAPPAPRAPTLRN